MPGAESFATIAEVAIAFLGFTGVVGVFAGRGHAPAILVRLWVMVAYGLGLLLLAILPTVLHHLGWVAPSIWVLCSTATLVLLSGHLFLVLPRVIKHKRAGEWGDVPAALDHAFPLAYLACYVTQVLNLLGVGLERSLGGFLLGLFLLLAASGFNFITLLVALWASESGQA